MAARRGAATPTNWEGEADVNVLVVDDDEAIRDTLAFALEDEGYDIRTACDGEQALEILRAWREPAVVLLDLMMPRMSGADVLCAVEGDPALALHAFILVTAAERSLPLPLVERLTRLAVPVLPKPFDLRVLLGRVMQATNRLDLTDPRLPAARA